MLSSPSQAVCGSPATSVPQCWHVTAGTLRWRVGSGCSGRCAPACGLPLGLLVGALDALRPCEGGVLELSGVFGGRLSFPRSAAFSASRAASSLLNSSIRASNVAISASFSALVRAGESKGGITHTLTHIRPPDATAFTIIESICRTKPCSHNRGLSNYVAHECPFDATADSPAESCLGRANGFIEDRYRGRILVARPR